MASVKIRDLSVGSYVQGITWWSYKAGSHTAEDITSAGYFDDFRFRDTPGSAGIAAGDWIMVSGPRWGMQLYVIDHTPHVVVSPVAATMVHATIDLVVPA